MSKLFFEEQRSGERREGDRRVIVMPVAFDRRSNDRRVGDRRDRRPEA
jgi:hypothetical protein